MKPGGRETIAPRTIAPRTIAPRGAILIGTVSPHPLFVAGGRRGRVQKRTAF
ncbi:MAG: hypothetical protein R6W67_00640 [Bacteroidales bacterium]